MNALRRHGRLTGWLGVLAILAALLGPSFSAALASASGGEWVEICTSQGARWVQPDEGVPDPSPASAHTPGHCPYCSLHAPVLGLPPATGTLQAPKQVAPPVPRPCRPAPRTLDIGVGAQPRAPPPSLLIT